MALLLLGLSILPVLILLIYIYRQDKYEKEPLGLLMLAFFGGIVSIFIDLALISGVINQIWYSDSVFYSAFWEAGFPEELSKFIVLFLLIWRNKNFNEHMDGIVYATFVGLGFACLENVLYVIEGGIGVGIIRALISVPGHFLFGVMMGYFLSLAKFDDRNRVLNLVLAIAVPAIAHGLFDWLLMVTDNIGAFGQLIILGMFIALDVIMWIVGVKSIRTHREKSPFKNAQPNV